MNHITYHIELTQANAPIIDTINELLGVTSGSAKAPAKEAEKPVKAEKPAKESKAETSGTTFDEFKKAAIKVKKEHGEDFAMEVLKEAGVNVTTKLGTSISTVKEELYDSIMQDWLDGPKVTEAASDELDDDDGFGDDDEDEAEITPETVTAMLKAHAKDKSRDEAKKIMNDNGASSLSKVADCSAKQLKAMFDALV